MKKFCITLFLLSILLLTLFFGYTKKQPSGDQYLRLHVRADSNLAPDQQIKYSVKEVVINYLTPIVSMCNSKKQSIQKLKDNIKNVTLIVNNHLKSKGFNYACAVSINKEYFPTRIYKDLTLKAGYYDSLIIKLGSGSGDNWWCVVYPPLCFNNQTTAVEYISKIQEIIQHFKNKLKK